MPSIATSPQHAIARNRLRHHADARLPRHARPDQAGFSLVETGFVILIVSLIAVIGFPYVQGMVIESRVPPVSNEIKRVIASTKTLAEGSSVTPYAGISNAQNLARTLEGSSVLRLSGATVAHRLGGAGTGTNGTVTIAPAALGGGATGSAFSLTLTSVNKFACPILAGTLNAMAESITINGQSVKTLDHDGTVTLAYNPTSAQQHCTSGDTNTFVFVTR